MAEERVRLVVRWKGIWRMLPLCIVEDHSRATFDQFQLNELAVVQTYVCLRRSGVSVTGSGRNHSPPGQLAHFDGDDEVIRSGL